MRGEWSPFRAYAGKASFICPQDVFTLLLLVAAGCWFFHAAGKLPAYHWSWTDCLRFFVIHNPDTGYRPGLLLLGLFTTLRVGFWTFIFSLLLGFLLGTCVCHKNRYLTIIYQGWINLIRNIPPLIILFCVYFIVGNLVPTSLLEDWIRKLPALAGELAGWLICPHGQLDKMITAVLALGLYQSAYVAEIVRGAIESVSQGQWDAGLALGLDKWTILRVIIMPQGLRLAIAPLTGQCITTFKDSSLASLISLPDLTFQSLEIMATSSLTFEVWISAALLYLLLGMLCAWLGQMLERHYTTYINT